jgi:hypothetical protein
MQQLLDRVRAHNEECRQLAGAAADLASSRREIIAAFAELGIRQKKASGELVKLVVTLTETAEFEAPDFSEVSDFRKEPPKEDEPADPLAIPAELDRRKEPA